MQNQIRARGTNGRSAFGGLARRRGSVLIVAIGIIIVLTGLTLVFARQMRVEALAAGNLFNSIQADAIVRGAAQHVRNRLVSNSDPSTLDSEIQSEEVSLGEGRFWMLRPNPADERQFAWGVADEASKLNINTATYDMLLALPGMTPELAASIVDWRDPDDNVTQGLGAENSYYLLLPEPYACKNGPFETLDELLLVKGATKETLFGVDANRNGVVDETEAARSGPLAGLNGQAQCGVCKYLTCYSAESNTTQAGRTRTFVGDTNGGTLNSIRSLLSRSLPENRVGVILANLRRSAPATNVLDFYVKAGLTTDEFKPLADQITTNRGATIRGRINVNTASREVLRCLPGMEDADVDLILAKRAGNGADRSNLAWIAAALAPAKAARIGGLITTRSFQYLADVVGVSGNGRSFKRIQYLFDLRTSPARVLHSKDLTYLGWPLSGDIWQALHNGEAGKETADSKFSLGIR